MRSISILPILNGDVYKRQRQEEPDPNWPVAIGDIRVAEKPERIVSLSPALTEVLYELGGGDRMAGVSAYCDFPADIGDLPDCGTAQSPDLNRLRELSPDVVFAVSYTHLGIRRCARR